MAMGDGELSDTVEETTPNLEATPDRRHSLRPGKEPLREKPATKMGKRKSTDLPRRDGGVSIRDSPTCRRR